MSIISNDEPRLALSLSDAEDGFWSIIIEAYPEATTGDLSPHQAFNLSAAMRSALVEWLQFNCDVPPEPPKTVEIMLHRIEYYYRDREYYYRDRDDMTITDSDKEQIAYCISQGISSGELCTNEMVDEDSTVYGWWEINNNPE